MQAKAEGFGNSASHVLPTNCPLIQPRQPGVTRTTGGGGGGGATTGGAGDWSITRRVRGSRFNILGVSTRVGYMSKANRFHCSVARGNGELRGTILTGRSPGRVSR